MSRIILLPRFHREIHLHLVSNYLDLGVRPIILGIFGRTGDGKSAQLAAGLTESGVDILRLNAGDLESSLAGEPGKLVARTYAVASLAIDQGVPSALVVDDVDTTVGEWELNTGTVNHQQVLAELMHLADRPTDRSRNYPRRVPVFVTGNNLSRLYPPLRRHGRMTVFGWRPTVTEVRDVVQSLLADISTPSALHDLIKEFSQEPLAFFAEVRQAIIELTLHSRIVATTTDMRVLLKSPASSNDSLSFPSHPVDSRELLRIAHELSEHRRAGMMNFLHEDEERK